MAKKASLAIKKGSLAKKASLANKTPSPKQKAVKSRPRQKPRLCSAEAVEGAANTIAKHIAEAEHKFFIAAEAIKESERVARMAEDCDAVVMHLKEILEQCKSSPSLSPTCNICLHLWDSGRLLISSFVSCNQWKGRSRHPP